MLGQAVSCLLCILFAQMSLICAEFVLLGFCVRPFGLFGFFPGKFFDFDGDALLFGLRVLSFMRSVWV